MTALTVQELTGGYAAADHVVKGVSFTVASGELVCVIGPNGAGKSTVLKLLTGLLRPRAGQVALDGRDITGQSPRVVIEAGMVLVPQERNVFGTLSVEENLAMGCFLDPGRAKARMTAVMDRFPLLAERRRQAARTMSGGQRQILAMGQALMSEPRVLLLDEPTAGLSPKAATDLFALVRATAETGVAVLMVEQNALQAMQISDRALVLVDGRNAHEGPAPALARDPAIRRLFLGGRGEGRMDATGTNRETSP
ncbi:ABC transporter ATP-binding protein [Neoroseomonas lacus]|uniref:ABC transporter ATP-binding protein n=1 Tax=Neoroseomonas lacus TaxID=287609 RepID=A0A917NQA4_9PROT|nr:ABC transporter ATP-binding protein [Neoroseomonas lacus]GGJ19115.1 ABC transporter ATP-binding protein [Neoroseomonas lacus]